MMSGEIQDPFPPTHTVHLVFDPRTASMDTGSIPNPTCFTFLVDGIPASNQALSWVNGTTLLVEVQGGACTTHETCEITSAQAGLKNTDAVWAPPNQIVQVFP